MTTPIVDFVRVYSTSGTARLHMPGHKGKAFLGCEALDITEIPGADELYAADGIIAESERNAARLFGTAQTFYSTEGSSQCIRAMLALALQAAPAGQRPVLLAARNAHKALLYAAALLDFDIAWLWPAPGSGGGLCACPIAAQELSVRLETMAQTAHKPFGVYVTSPDYLGGMQEIAALAAVCAAQNVPLLVDNAHGAYLPFLPEGSRHPIALGATMCCDSGHKTLPVLTGGAYLHLGPNAPVQDETTVRSTLALFGSTSPSYLILQSLDLCNRCLAEDYPQRLAACAETLLALRRELNFTARATGCPVPLALDGADIEPLKLTLDAVALGQTGNALADFLRTRGVECEYADPRHVVLMATPENSPEDISRVRDALLDAMWALPARTSPVALPDSGAEEAELFAALAKEARQCCTIRQAVLSPQETVPTAEALGRVCAMPTVSCPPAIPIAVSGESIGPAALRLFAKYGVERVEVKV